MDNKLTKKRLHDLLSYEWILMIIICVVSIVFWEIVYDFSAVKLTAGQNFRYYFDYNISPVGNTQLRQELIDKEIRRAEIPNMNEFKEEFTQFAMKKFSLRNPDDMYATVGFEGTISNKIILKLKDELKKLTSAKEDKEILAPLNEIKNVVNYIGKLSLIDSCAVIGEADVMLSGDSGPLHIATALGVKSIGLYGSMPANRTGCFSSGINIVSKKSCVPCNRRKCKFLKKTKNIYAPCMEEISVEEILEKINL